MLYAFKITIMNNEFRVITGTAKEVETELNKLNKTHWVIIQGITATNEQTTIVIDMNKRE
jgi:hypothetical protein